MQIPTCGHWVSTSLSQVAVRAAVVLVPEGQADCTRHLRLALLSQLAEVFYQALEHRGIATQLGLGVLAVRLDIRGAVGEDANVVAVVGLHLLLTLLQLLLAVLAKVGLCHVLHQALDHAGLPGLLVLRVHKASNKLTLNFIPGGGDSTCRCAVGQGVAVAHVSSVAVHQYSAVQCTSGSTPVQQGTSVQCASGRQRVPLSYLAVHGLLLGAQLVELGPEPDVAVLNGGQLELLIAAGIADLVAVQAQALVHTALACRGRGKGQRRGNCIRYYSH